MVERNLIANYVHFHSSGAYGYGGKHLPWVLPHIMAFKPASLIDYGAGRSFIAQRLGRKAGIADVVSFDPAVPERSTLPDRRFAVIVSFDVLEHIPEEEMDAVLGEMARLAPDALHVIDTRPAIAILEDGRNAHVSQHDEAWWLERLGRFWPHVVAFPMRNGRVGIKTWTTSFPTWRHNLMTLRERVKMRLRKRLGIH
ncbi:class I SAM-dependent methyltransferase [Ciceribacter sp. L1K22]|uniref:SAM-dependent methyltransferase n=1 Tax=Ciceribacter sp. L1K22 TaxID=2820275 RepID=UPI001ABEB969|nr:class I SAM-dependent methyltransferase [Ciceribacter sp. L1K22]MBO3761211.1 class I SAM-dependent methyltransferase [Ciceribacter sp. L1K22]